MDGLTLTDAKQAVVLGIQFAKNLLERSGIARR